MFKKLSELSKDEKILLLKAVADKEIEPDQINEEDTLFAIGRGSLFACVMVAASPGNEGKNIVCLGEEAKKDQKIFASFRELKELNFEFIESSGLYKCQEDGEEVTEQQIKAMEKDYLISIEITSDLTQPAAAYKLVPRSKEMYLYDLQTRNKAI